MTVLEKIITATEQLGYRPDAVRRDYAYSDVWSAPAPIRRVPFVAFTQTPPSYRSAAIAAVHATESGASATVSSHRALGAPLIFVIEPHQVTRWQVYSNKAPRLLDRCALDEIDEYFAKHQEEWKPDAIHRAKSIGRIDANYQLDFVDVGLIPRH